MIGEGRFQTYLSVVEKVLEYLRLLEEKTPSPNKHLGRSHFKGMDYRQTYEEMVREFVYDFRLVDQSLLLFCVSGANEHDGDLRFSYYECPIDLVPYSEFVEATISDLTAGEDTTEVAEQWGDLFRSEYEQYVLSQESKKGVTPIRYDYSPSQYQQGRHPASHLHFGFRSEIRVATRKVMNPVSFVLFVVRQCYPKRWDALLGDERRGPLWTRQIREAIDAVHDDYWRELDRIELVMH